MIGRPSGSAVSVSLGLFTGFKDVAGFIDFTRSCMGVFSKAQSLKPRGQYSSPGRQGPRHTMSFYRERIEGKGDKPITIAKYKSPLQCRGRLGINITYDCAEYADTKGKCKYELARNAIQLGM